MFSRYEFKQDIENQKLYDSNIKIINITEFSFYNKNETEFLADVVFVTNLFEKEYKYNIDHGKILHYCSDKYILAKVEFKNPDGKVREINKYPIDVKMLSPNAIIRFCALAGNYEIFDYIDQTQAISNEQEEANAEKVVSKLRKDLRVSFANGAKTKLSIKNYEK